MIEIQVNVGAIFAIVNKWKAIGRLNAEHNGRTSGALNNWHPIRSNAFLIKEIFDKKGLAAKDIDWFLPHISSNFFKSKIYDLVEIYGGGIPYEKWFINLYTVGNVGAASVYLMIDELFNNGKLKKGEKILLLVPESSRFSYMYAMLTVV